MGFLAVLLISIFNLGGVVGGCTLSTSPRLLVLGAGWSDSTL